MDILKREEDQFRMEFEELQKEAAKLGTKSFELEDLKAEIQERENFRNRIQDEIHALNVELQALRGCKCCRKPRPRRTGTRSAG